MEKDKTGQTSRLEFEPKEGVGYDVVEERLLGTLCYMCANKLACTEGCGLQEEISRTLFPEEVEEEIEVPRLESRGHEALE